MHHLHFSETATNINPVSPLQQTKLAIIEHVHLAKDALHIYVALIVFFGSCILFKWKAHGWRPWFAVLAVCLIGELWDIRDRIVFGKPIMLAANWKDIWNTMLVPSIVMLAARRSNIFAKN